MTKISITNRYSGEEIFGLEGEGATVAQALLAALKSGANLYGADLCGADLCGADLCGANLRGADLYGADLYGADLYGADLYGANLRGADLYGANLRGADLRGAKIDGEIIKAEPLCVNGLHWWVLITDGFMRIGCQRHSHAEWAAFTDAQIEEMAGEAPEFWATWKAPLLAMCERQAAKAAGVAPEVAAEAA